MVFRGKPSKACQRCRDRKLRCDLQRPSCSSCLRAGTRCHGYRDTGSLRMTDETQTVKSKSTIPKGEIPPKQTRKHFNLAHLPLHLEVQARELFFAYYIEDFSRNWDFIYPYLNSKVAPDHLSLSIDAVSLAFLSHHFTSPSARNLGRLKYVSALRKMNTALQDTSTAREATTLDASLLLDLFEKLTKPASISDETQRAHIDGALALVKLRGLEHFNDVPGLRTLTRLALNALVCSISQNHTVPAEVFDIREHLEKFVDTKDPKFRATGVTLQVTNLMSEIENGNLSPRDKIKKSTKLDEEFAQISHEASPYWTYRRVYISAGGRSDRILDDFYDVYDSRMTTQMWNVLRLTRILLCEGIMEASSAAHDEESFQYSQRAATVIETSIREICASVPQMTDCGGAARHKLPPGAPTTDSHGHTLSHFLDIYILLFALYVAAWSPSCSARSRIWIARQLEWMATHFGVKEAVIVSEAPGVRDVDAGSGRQRPWAIYRLLGSYAFAA
ncbi:putative C6 transcription factor [Massarina eburnea CBS 473.64]|uniref:Putative C6 transcription factor n=1 Tax=Massarina eburnea CBS 473.64 TaxID=1395130 RepID=A0A6A6SDX3_9PLEO|nr:putative C6 transcription factor [Massarina eburnea CBS 473.64]